MRALLQRLEQEVTGMRERAMVLLPDQILGKQRRMEALQQAPSNSP